MVTLSERGFVKRVPAQAYALQHRGGRGIIGMSTREEDAVRFLLSADTHDAMLFFTNKGRVFSIKCHEIPLDISRISKGTAVVNLFPINPAEKVTAVVPVRIFKPGTFLIMATTMGEAKKVAVEAFASVRSSGLLAMDLSKNDSLVGATMGTDDNEVIMVSRDGQSIRFPVNELRDSLRASGGVDGFKLIDDDQVVSLDIVNPQGYLLVVTAGGFGKITALEEYPVQHRAGSRRHHLQHHRQDRPGGGRHVRGRVQRGHAGLGQRHHHAHAGQGRRPAQGHHHAGPRHAGGQADEAGRGRRAGGPHLHRGKRRGRHSSTRRR